MRLKIGFDGFSRACRSELSAGWNRAGIAVTRVCEIVTVAAASAQQHAFRLPATGRDH